MSVIQGLRGRLNRYDGLRQKAGKAAVVVGGAVLGASAAAACAPAAAAAGVAVLAGAIACKRPQRSAAAKAGPSPEVH